MATNTHKGRFSLGTTKGTSTIEMWDAVDPSLLLQVVQSLSVIKVGLTISTTRDGEAVSLVLLDGDSRTKLYASNADALEELLESIRIQADAMSAG